MRSASADKGSMPPPVALCTGRIRLPAHMLLACAATCRALHPRHGTPADASSKALPARIPGDSSEDAGLGEPLGALPGLLLDAEESMVVRCDMGFMLWMLGVLLAGRLRPAAFRFISTCACTPVLARQRQTEGERGGRKSEKKREIGLGKNNGGGQGGKESARTRARERQRPATRQTEHVSHPVPVLAPAPAPWPFLVPSPGPFPH